MEKSWGVHLPTKKTRGNYKKRKVDRLSELPDHILGLILSHLSLKEAARTSIVSSRWRDVIRDTVLDFHDRPITLKDYNSLPTPTEFSDRVDEVLKNHKEPTLSVLIVKSDWLFSSTLSHRILNWIYFAIRKRVQRLDLALSNYRYLETFHERTMAIWTNSAYSIPCLGHSFPSLNFLISKVEGFSRFVTTLRVLRLQCFNVDGELLAYLLYNCPVLEHLSVSFSNSLVPLEVRARSTVKLKYFEIYHCTYSPTIHFDDAPNLECIRCSGYFRNISIKSAPNLINVSLVDTFCNILDNVRHLSNNLSQLEVLTLEIESRYGSPPLTFSLFPILTHLKHLILKLQRRHSYLDLNSLFIAMPSLYRLHLTVEEEMTLVKPSTCCHKCLKLVEWVGYYIGDFNDCSFVRFLAQTCKVLEKITITKRKWSRPVPRYDEEDLVEYEKLSMQMLEGVEVIIQSQKLPRRRRSKR